MAVSWPFSLFFSLLACPAPVALAGSRTVEFTFNVSYFEVNPDHHGHTWIQGINGAIPGPEIRVKRHDRLRVTVNNQLATEHVSVHWHGFEMRGAQEYDGAMGVTQCGIHPGKSFTYDFVVDEHPGTYMYHEHAHLEHVAARGMFGALVVEPEDGSVGLWQYDREATLMLTDWWRKSNHELERMKQGQLSRPGTVSALGNNVGILPFHNLLINGKGAFDVFGPQPALAPGYLTHKTHVSELAQITPAAGETWRLRIANGGSLWAMRFRIDGHKLRIIQTDGSDTEEETVDAVSMSSGERFDVLVTFDRPPGSYWMRVETLEVGPSLHHGQLGILRYRGTPETLLPTMGFPRAHRIQDAPELVTMNCIDQAPTSDKCRSVTELRRHHGTPGMAGTRADTTHDFEVSFRGFTGEADSHFTRLIDLTQEGNHIGDNQHGGEFVQFQLPLVPYSHVNGTEHGQHKNTLAMHVKRDEYVRVVLQLQDRAAHPWHLHGHKFAVLGIGFPDYQTQCDVLYCRSKHNRWLSRDGFPALLDPDEAPLKDTVHVPAGGWAVIQFKADNPGWWLFHCHMAVHLLDGMGLVLVEAPNDVPERLTDLAYLHEERGMPSCERELEHLREEGNGLSCSCWQNPEMKIDNLPRSSYRCSQPYLCADQVLLQEEPQEHWRIGKRSRDEGRLWRGGMLAGWVGVVVTLFLAKRWARLRVRARALLLTEMVQELRRECGFKISELVSRVTRTSTIPHLEHGQRPGPRCSVADMGQLMTSLPEAGLQLEFRVEASGRRSVARHGVEKAHVMAGVLPPGSIVALLGCTVDTEPWLQFFAGRRQRENVRIPGSLRLGGECVTRWSQHSLRFARGYISGIQTLRPSCSVGDFLALPLLLSRAPDLYNSKDERYLHMIKFVSLFHLEEHLARRMGSLDDEILLKVLLAQEVVLPRAVLVIREPLRSLKPPAATRMMKVFKLLADKLRVTIIFSCDGLIPGEAGKIATHTMMLGQPFKSFFASQEELPQTLSALGLSVPSGREANEWASEISVKAMSPDSEESTRTSWLSGSSTDTPPLSEGFADPCVIAIPEGEAGQHHATMRQRFDVRQPKCFLSQLGTLLEYQLVGNLEDSITVYRAIETFGIGILAGLVWFRKGSEDTQTALGETIGLFFFTTALYTVPPVFQVIAVAPSEANRISCEYLAGMYPLYVCVISITLASWVTVIVWAPVWQIVAYFLADLGPGPSAVLAMQMTLMLNVLAMRMIGYSLAMVVPSAALNVVIANVFAQSCMLTNGFYTKLHPWLQWITVISVPRFTFRALLKLEYSWKDTFEVHPMYGVAAFGNPTSYIPAELTGTFQLMAERQMDVMASPHDSSPAFEMSVMVGISGTFMLLFLFALALRVRKLEELPIEWGVAAEQQFTGRDMELNWDMENGVSQAPDETKDDMDAAEPAKDCVALAST